VRVEEIGSVEEGSPGAFLLTGQGIRDFTPRFRESAYTPVKKVVDRGERDFDEMKAAVEAAALAAVEKKERMVARLRKKL